MEVSYFTLSVLSAFGLGACPFSVWIGQWFLGKDIRDYGDGNPGAANVFRAGGRKSGLLAVILDTAKGIPFVFLAYSFFKLPEAAVMAVALSAILGHAFSPSASAKRGKGDSRYLWNPCSPASTRDAHYIHCLHLTRSSLRRN